MRAAIAGSGLQSGVENLLLQFRSQHLGLALPLTNARDGCYPDRVKAVRNARIVGRDRFNCRAIV